MGVIKVVNITKDDVSMDDGYFYIGRSKTMKSPLANPFTHNGKRSSLAKLSFKTREQAIAAYEAYFDAMLTSSPRHSMKYTNTTRQETMSYWDVSASLKSVTGI